MHAWHAIMMGRMMGGFCRAAGLCPCFSSKTCFSFKTDYGCKPREFLIF